MEGYQKSGMVRFAILVPFTTSDNGNGHNCVPYRTVLNRTARWKQAISVVNMWKEQIDQLISLFFDYTAMRK